MNKELSKILTTALVQFIDKERPEGTMCCSNAECKSIEKMFEGDKFDIIEAFIQKKLSRLTEFELRLLDWLSSDTSGEIPMERMKEIVKNRAVELLALAKKELCNGCNANLEGYIKGQQDAKRQYDESVAYLGAMEFIVPILTWIVLIVPERLLEDFTPLVAHQQVTLLLLMARSITHHLLIKTEG